MSQPDDITAPQLWALIFAGLIIFAFILVTSPAIGH